MKAGTVLGDRLCLGIGTGNPGVFWANPYPNPRKPVPLVMGTGFGKYGYGFVKNPRVSSFIMGS